MKKKSYAITIYFPVSAHVYKYLTKKYGEETIESSRSDSIGYLIISILNRTPDEKPATKAKDKFIPIKIKESHYAQNGMYIDNSKIDMFDKLVDHLLREELLMFILANSYSAKTKFYDSFRTFCDFYNITDRDINLDSLLRDMKRRKKAYHEQQQAKLFTA